MENEADQSPWDILRQPPRPIFDALCVDDGKDRGKAAKATAVPRQDFRFEPLTENPCDYEENYTRQFNERMLVARGGGSGLDPLLIRRGGAGGGASTATSNAFTNADVRTAVQFRFQSQIEELERELTCGLCGKQFRRGDNYVWGCRQGLGGRMLVHDHVPAGQDPEEALSQDTVLPLALVQTGHIRVREDAVVRREINAENPLKSVIHVRRSHSLISRK